MWKYTDCQNKNLIYFPLTFHSKHLVAPLEQSMQASRAGRAVVFWQESRRSGVSHVERTLPPAGKWSEEIVQDIIPPLPMQKVNIPRTDLYASTLVLGTDYFGSTVSRERSMQLMDRYLEAGGNVIDTAELYARWVPGGEHQSEKVIGEWLRDRGVRDELVLSSLESFRQAGKIRYAGFSNWTQMRAEEARQAAQRLGLQGFVASQNMWSFAKVNLPKADPTWAYIDEPFARWHREHGIAAFAYLTQASGFFRRLEQGTLDQVPADAGVRTLFDQR